MRHALRTLRRDGGYSAAASLTLAVCLGANCAIFAIVDAVLLRPLPVPEGDRILLMANRYPKAAAGDTFYSSGGDYYDRLKAVTAFSDQAAFQYRNQTVEINGVPQHVSGMEVTPSLFRLLRVAPKLGRTFSDEEGEPGNEAKVVLSHGLWMQMFGGDASVVGRSVRISGRPYAVIGVMPAGFRFVDPQVRLWVPLAFTAEQRQGHHSNNWYNIGRLKRGASLLQAQAQVDALNAANLERFPQWRELLVNARFHTVVLPLEDMLVRDVRNTLLMLWIGAGFVLLIGAANLANLSLARLNQRRRELVTRLALGAGRRDLVGQLLAENLVLAAAGAAGGVLIALGVLRGLQGLLQNLPRAEEVQLDAAAIVFTCVAALMTGLALSIVPLAGIFGFDLNSLLREEGRTSAGGRRSRGLRHVMVTAQIGIAFVLLFGAVLLVTSFRQLLHVDPGYRTEGVVTASVRFPRVKYKTARELRSLIARITESLRAIPGVAAAGATTNIPLGGDFSDGVILAEGYVMKPGESVVSPKRLLITPGYLEAMGVALVRGRYFTDADDDRSPRVILIDEQLAAKFWPGADPVGRRMYQPRDVNHMLTTDETTEWYRVAGVVKSVRMEDLAGNRTSAGAYYFPYAQGDGAGGTFAVRTTLEAAAVIRGLRASLAQIDPELAVFDIRMMAERVNLSVAPRRTALSLAVAFGVIAILLSAIGVYGVLAYLVTQRRRELGIRMALGSSRGGVFRLLMSEGALLTGLGLGLGLLAAVFLQGVLAKQVYGVQALDPWLLALSALGLGAVALLASVLPAMRAMRVDPVSVLNDV